MQTPDVKPSLPAGACASTGPPTTFSASADVMILQTSIVLPEPEPEPPLAADVLVEPPDDDPELLPQPARTTSAATAAAAPTRALRRMTMSLPRDPYVRVHGMRAPIAYRGPVPYCAPGGSDDGPRAPLAQERDPRTAAGSRAASDPAHADLGGRPPLRTDRDVRRSPTRRTPGPRPVG